MDSDVSYFDRDSLLRRQYQQRVGEGEGEGYNSTYIKKIIFLKKAG